MVSWYLGLVRLLGGSPFVLNFGAETFSLEFMDRNLGHSNAGVFSNVVAGELILG